MASKGEVTTHKWWTLTAVCAATFMLLLDITIVNVALPPIQAALHTTFSDLQWVVDAYSLMLATIVLNAGSLADRYGRKKIFMTGIVLFTAASAVCGAARSPGMLIISRAIQGIGGGIMFATSLSLLAQDFHGKERGLAFGVWGAITGAAIAIGPLAGGLLINYADWRWIFYVNLPIGIATLIAASLRLHESRNTQETQTDWAGVVVLSAALFCFVFALIKGNLWRWSSTSIISLLAASFVLGVLFLGIEAYRKQPILKLSLFTKPSFTGAQLAALTTSGSLLSLFLYITIYFQDVLGYSALQAGLRFLPVTLVAFVVAGISGRLTSKIPGRYMISIGLMLVGLGLVLAGGVGIDSSWTHLLPGLMTAGFGLGMINPSLANVAIGVVPPQESGMASGVNNTFRQVGIAGGVAVLGAIFQTSISHTLSSSLRALHLTTSQLANMTSAVSGGESRLAASHFPAAYRALALHASHQAFVNGFNLLIVVTASTAFVGMILAFSLIRTKDMAVYEPGARAPEA
jgi:EmrB/QacA subfamily drug resistance transporter